MEKKLLERKILKCIWKMSIKDFEKYKYDKCGKNFTHNIGLKGHVFHVENISLNQPVESDDSNVFHVENISLNQPV